MAFHHPDALANKWQLWIKILHRITLIGAFFPHHLAKNLQLHHLTTHCSRQRRRQRLSLCSHVPPVSRRLTQVKKPNFVSRETQQISLCHKMAKKIKSQHINKHSSQTSRQKSLKIGMHLPLNILSRVLKKKTIFQPRPGSPSSFKLNRRIQMMEEDPAKISQL